MLSYWIRDERNRKIGYIVAGIVQSPDDGEFYVNVDYSYCGGEDRFDPVFAQNLAKERCIHAAFRKKRIRGAIHPSVYDDYGYMVNRALKYYRGGKPSPKVQKFLDDLSHAEVM